MKRLSLLSACVAAAGLSLVISGCRDATFHNVYSTDQEQAMGHQEDQSIVAQSKIDSDAADNTRIQAIAQPIFDQARKMRPDVQYTIKIIDSPEINAFSIAGGYIYIYTGLLDKLGKDDDAVAAVIGHESAHVVRRHDVKQISDAGIKGGLVELLGITTNSANVYNTASAVYQLEQLHYSREDEYEADKYGLMYAYNAGFDPQGMIRTFHVLEALDKATGATSAYAEDHPISKNRELRAEDLIKMLKQNHGVYPNDPNIPSGTTGATATATPKTY